MENAIVEVIDGMAYSALFVANSGPKSSPTKNNTNTAPNGMPERIPAIRGLTFSATQDKPSTRHTETTILASNKDM
jgi:hypothetical protein